MFKSLTLLNILCALLIVNINAQADYRGLFTTSSACQSGRLQSPVNLMDYYSAFNSTINTVYETYNPITNARLAYNGRVLALNQTTGASTNWGYVGFLRGGVMKQYQLIGVEVNTPGEHQIEGVQPDVEVKFIHQRVLGYQSSVDQFRRIPDANNYLTVSILYRRTSTLTDNGLLSDLLTTVTGFNSNNGFNFRNSFTFSPDSYGVFRDRQLFFYEGSFTYTPCDENANVIVFKDMYYISPTNLNFLLSVYNGYYTNGSTNKAIANYYGRQISRNYMNMTEASAGFLSLGKSAIFMLIAIAGAILL